LVEQALPAVARQLEFLLRVRLERAALPEQLAPLRVLRQRVLLVLLRQQARLLAVRRLAREHVGQLAQQARRPLRVSRARQQMVPGLRVRAWRLLPLQHSRLFRKLRRLRRQLRPALIV
jgi:hypothetical protein